MLRSLYMATALSSMLFSNISAADDFTFKGAVNDALGIQQVDAENLNSMSCEDLYVVVSSLAPKATHYRSVFINEKTELLVSGLSSFVKPIAYSYYAATIPWHYKEAYRVQQNTLVLDYLRQRMAAMRCFEK